MNRLALCAAALLLVMAVSEAAQEKGGEDETGVVQRRAQLVEAVSEQRRMDLRPDAGRLC